jgi:hypothetical protein
LYVGDLLYGGDLLYVGDLFLEWEIFQAKDLEKIKTHIVHPHFFFRKLCLLWDNVKKML